MAADAIVRVHYRLLASRRKLLQWQTAASAHAEAHVHMDATLRRLLMVAGLTVVFSIAMLVKQAFVPASGFLFLWIASPLLMKWLARPEKDRNRRKLSADETRFLRQLARKTLAILL